ncbi:MAG: Ig-like domain-containing protein [Anaerolineae bacterium]|nr:Ig-like domain-containing protein [Anaerolineae bacterium]
MARMRKVGALPWFLGLGILVAVVAVATLVILSGTGGVRLEAISPGDGAGDVAITAPVRLSFSEAMDPGSVEAHFSVEPPVEGRWVFEGTDATFWPAAAWSPARAYTITLQAGATAGPGRELQEDRVWQFETREPQLLYLQRTAVGGEVRQLFAAVPGSGQPRQLTEHPLGVFDYAVHPQGEAIVYSVLREDGGSDLWQMDRQGQKQRLLLACPEEACLGPAWSAGGDLLAFERRGIWAGAPNLDPQAARIWLLDPESGEDRPLFDYDVPLHSPVWAPAGQLLAYLSPVASGIEVYDLVTEELFQFGSEWGAVPAWSPDSRHLVVPELMLVGEDMVVRLLRLDLDGGGVLDISGQEEMVQDVAPAWSPGGGWIAFGRQLLDAERWTPGRQIWLSRPDGSEAYPLLQEPMADHFALRWRPDGAVLAYLREDLSQGPQPQPDVAVWVYDLVRRETTFVAGDAVLPGWLP